MSAGVARKVALIYCYRINPQSNCHTGTQGTTCTSRTLLQTSSLMPMLFHWPFRQSHDTLKKTKPNYENRPPEPQFYSISEEQYQLLEISANTAHHRFKKRQNVKCCSHTGLCFYWRHIILLSLWIQVKICELKLFKIKPHAILKCILFNSSHMKGSRYTIPSKINMPF